MRRPPKSWTEGGAGKLLPPAEPDTCPYRHCKSCCSHRTARRTDAWTYGIPEQRHLSHVAVSRLPAGLQAPPPPSRRLSATAPHTDHRGEPYGSAPSASPSRNTSASEDGKKRPLVARNKNAPGRTDRGQSLVFVEVSVVGAAGFEPTTSCSQGRHADQAALRPEPGPDTEGGGRDDLSRPAGEIQSLASEGGWGRPEGTASPASSASS